MTGQFLHTNKLHSPNYGPSRDGVPNLGQQGLLPDMKNSVNRGPSLEPDLLEYLILGAPNPIFRSP